MRKIYTYIIAVLISINVYGQENEQISFVKLSDNIGTVIDSLEYKQCNCLPNQNHETFRHAFIIQRPDSFVVLYSINKGSNSYKKEFLTPVSIKSIHRQSEKYASNITSYYNTKSEDQIAKKFTGDSKYSIRNIKQVYFVDYLTKPRNQKNTPYSSSTKSNTYYVNFSGGITLPYKTSLDYGFNSNLSKNVGLSVGRTSALRKAKKLPSDYYGGLSLFGGGDGDPMDYLDHYSIRIIKNYNQESKFIRYGIEAGPSVVNNRIARFTKKRNRGLFEKNYNVSFDNNYTLGLSTKAKIEFPITTLLGVEVSTIHNLNPIQSYVGVQWGLIIGKVRYKSNPK